MDTDEVVEFLTWLEKVFPVQLRFNDKEALARGFVDHRGHRLYQEWEAERATGAAR